MNTSVDLVRSIAASVCLTLGLARLAEKLDPTALASGADSTAGDAHRASQICGVCEVPQRSIGYCATCEFPQRSTAYSATCELPMRSIGYSVTCEVPVRPA